MNRDVKIIGCRDRERRERLRREGFVSVPSGAIRGGNRCVDGDESKPTRRRKLVRFDSVAVAEFLYTIGDSPAVSGGVPLSIAHKPIRQQKLNLEEYERLRLGRRRHGPSLLIGKDRRERMCVLIQGSCSGVCLWLLHSLLLSSIVQFNRRGLRSVCHREGSKGGLSY